MKHSRFDNANESYGLLFWQVSTLWQRKIKEALHPYKLTHTQFVILAVTNELNERNLDSTQKEISNLSMIDVMTVSTTLRLLEKKNLIVRKNHPTDTRAKLIKNTKQGEEILKLVSPIIESVDDEFFFDNEDELAVFMSLLKKLNDKT